MVRIGIVAGEHSGDLLAAGLVNALKRLRSDLAFEGIGGQNLQEAGVKIHYPIDKLAVMGFSEVLKHCFTLHRIRNNLYKYFLQHPPDIFIGVDAPDFNFWLEKKLRDKGIKTVHFISPSIWAWRAYRLRSIAKSTDLMLTLFPFEKEIYDKHNINAKYIGHPLADRLPFRPDRDAMSATLGLDEKKVNIALLPGSRAFEIERLAPVFLAAATELAAKRKNLQFIVSLNSTHLKRQFEQVKRRTADQLPVIIFTDRSHQVIAASDVVLLASGTVTLEAMIMGKPMVVAYKLHWLSYLIARLLIQIPYFSLPNILSGEFIVPEYAQDACVPGRLADALLGWLDNKERTAALLQRFALLKATLKRDANMQAAKAILDCME